MVARQPQTPLAADRYSSTWSSPIRGDTREEVLEHRLLKRKEQRGRKKAGAAADTAQRQAVLAAIDLAVQRITERQEQARKTRLFDDILESLHLNGFDWGDFVLYVSDPASGRKQERWSGLFASRSRVERILDSWMSTKNNQSARKVVHEWIMSYVTRVIAQEGAAITQNGCLQMARNPVDSSFGLSFDIPGIYTNLHIHCPSTVRVLQAFCTTQKQEKAMTLERQEKKQKVSINKCALKRMRLTLTT